MEIAVDIDLVREAWRVRRQHFAPEIFFHHPVLTRSVSVTGTRCALKCAHCGGRFLKNMTPLDIFPAGRVRAATGQRIRSCLISGGCDERGRVPFAGQAGVLRDLKSRYNLRLNFHTGLVGEEEARLLPGLADAVSFDFVGDDGTIARILGLAARVEDYAASYTILRKYARVVPHLCIGLDAGAINGEYRALELLGELGMEALVFLVFMPTPGTPLAGQSPPPVADVVHLLARARLKFPGLPIHLGCMRPGGRYRRELDRWAVRCGVNRLVMPAPEAVEAARQVGLRARYEKECCVL